MLERLKAAVARRLPTSVVNQLPPCLRSKKDKSAESFTLCETSEQHKSHRKFRLTCEWFQIFGNAHSLCMLPKAELGTFSGYEDCKSENQNDGHS